MVDWKNVYLEQNTFLRLYGSKSRKCWGEILKFIDTTIK